MMITSSKRYESLSTYLKRCAYVCCCHCHRSSMSYELSENDVIANWSAMTSIDAEAVTQRLQQPTNKQWPITRFADSLIWKKKKKITLKNKHKNSRLVPLFLWKNGRLGVKLISSIELISSRNITMMIALHCNAIPLDTNSQFYWNNAS